jgi:predicted phage tail protein
LHPTFLEADQQMESKRMKYKVMEIVGVLLLVLGAALIILQFMAKEKSVIGSIASGASPIGIGAVLIGVSQMLERKKASIDRPDTPK